MRLEGKQNSLFPSRAELSVLLYSDERKINNIHTTIVCHAIKSKIYCVNEFKIKKKLTYAVAAAYLIACCVFSVFYIDFFISTQTCKIHYSNLLVSRTFCLFMYVASQ